MHETDQRQMQIMGLPPRIAPFRTVFYERLAAFLNEMQLIELVHVIGNYTKVAYLQNALRIRLGSRNKGLTAR